MGNKTIDEIHGDIISLKRTYSKNLIDLLDFMLNEREFIPNILNQSYIDNLYQDLEVNFPDF